MSLRSSAIPAPPTRVVRIRPRTILDRSPRRRELAAGWPPPRRCRPRSHRRCDHSCGTSCAVRFGWESHKTGRRHVIIFCKPLQKYFCPQSRQLQHQQGLILSVRQRCTQVMVSKKIVACAYVEDASHLLVSMNGAQPPTVHGGVPLWYCTPAILITLQSALTVVGLSSYVSVPVDCTSRTSTRTHPDGNTMK